MLPNDVVLERHQTSFNRYDLPFLFPRQFASRRSSIGLPLAVSRRAEGTAQPALNKARIGCGNGPGPPRSVFNRCFSVSNCRILFQFWAAYVPCDSQYKDAVQLTLEQIDVIRRFTEQYHPRLTLCTSAEDIKSAYKRHQLCSLIGVEGGHSLAGSLAVLRTLYHIGVRYLTLTSTCNTPWADCSHADMPGKKPEHGGLTNFGKSVIKEMNRIGMIVDLSHVSVNTMRDALEVSKAPVIFSHSSAHALCNSTRNVPDETLRKLALNKGVIMVNFYSLFLTCKEAATIADAVAHINHIREVAGVESVGLGAGYDGINYVPQGLEDVSSYPALFAELIGTGKWSVDDLKKLAGLNFLRVFQEAERIRDEFRKANVPPYEDVMTPKPKENNCTSQATF
ncbi:hypothetical protein NQ318_002896 [Aromia moschata]|uniref:Dipeptidase n=1 Tax=Aromia moschata TaxID=1265417 RepID=A0AAV8X8C8_9CUCU|nr:hypothetical protein NQ318_002896 [Aromia moschata]